ncbi:MAG: hypothetical protein EXR41_00980 [Candidatus Methylopumilus sp.]|nr:hypothetical protein [Candidatus Methylopumilus sp.]
MEAGYKKRILKELELFPLWTERNSLSQKLFVKEDKATVSTDLLYAFKVVYKEGSLLLLSQNFALGGEESFQDLFLNIIKFITTTVGIDTFQKNNLLRLTKDQLSDFFLKTPPKHILTFGLNNQFFEEYKKNDLMNNVTMNIKHTLDLNHLLQNPKKKKLVWEDILDLIKVFKSERT